jgi:hypothetical protein
MSLGAGGSRTAWRGVEPHTPPEILRLACPRPERLVPVGESAPGRVGRIDEWWRDVVVEFSVIAGPASRDEISRFIAAAEHDGEHVVNRRDRGGEGGMNRANFPVGVPRVAPRINLGEKGQQ